MSTNRQRRESERRRLQRQNQRRAQQAARRHRMLALVSVIGVLVVVAVVVIVVVAGSSEKSTAGAGGSKVSCSWTKSGTAARKASDPPTSVADSGTVTASVTTTQGPMTFALDRAAAPCTVASFASLAQQKYYDGTSCHRLTSGGLSVLQCGDPLGTGSGGPGYKFKDELTGSEKYTRGVLAMANSGADTNGSQFFIVYRDSQLGPNYTIFGRVASGLGVVDKVAAKGSTPTGDGKPNLPMTLQKVTVGK